MSPTYYDLVDTFQDQLTIACEGLNYPICDCGEDPERPVCREGRCETFNSLEDCYSPFENLHLAYVDEAVGCECNDYQNKAIPRGAVLPSAPLDELGLDRRRRRPVRAPRRHGMRDGRARRDRRRLSRPIPGLPRDAERRILWTKLVVSMPDGTAPDPFALSREGNVVVITQAYTADKTLKRPADCGNSAPQLDSGVLDASDAMVMRSDEVVLRS